MCYASKYVQPEKKMLEVDEYRDIWQQATRLGAFGAHVIGGEPTVRDELLDIISVLEPDRYLISLVTNGKIVDEAMIKEFAALKLFRICVSLDSNNEKENDSIRGEGSFQRAVDIIKLCKKHKITPEISFTLSKSSMSRFRKMLEYAYSEGILLGCSALSPTGRYEENFSECLDEDDWLIIRDNLSYLRFDFSHTFKGVACPGGIEKLCISPYGDIQTCAINPISFGNTRQRSLKDIWQDLHNNFSYFHKDRNYHRCTVAWDKEYQEKILKPLNDYNVNPVDISQHPFSQKVEEADKS